jgi:hypothetical protein
MASAVAKNSRPARLLMSAGAVLILIIALLPGVRAAARADAPKLPDTLRETGLYIDFESLRADPQHIAFSPQYPLWTDGATKRRWISLPAGTTIDGTDPDAWVFPIGTRLWKEFSFAGQRVETRYLERRADGQWAYAAYEWSADGREAGLASEKGKRGAYPLGGRRWHAIPGVNDCKACHQGGRSEVLGFSALQLSSDRDPNAPHAEARAAGDADLKMLIANGLLVGFPQALVEKPPHIGGSPAQRAALGYLHGNCGHCHNERGPLKNVELFLRHSGGKAVEPAIASTIGQPVKNAAPGQSPDAALRIEPGNPDRSALTQRVASRYSALQMPPLGTELVDKQAVELLRRWIAEIDESRGEANQEGKEK